MYESAMRDPAKNLRQPKLPNDVLDIVTEVVS
jgi:hypothetical protein